MAGRGVLILFLLFPASSLSAGVRLNGGYETSLDLVRDNRPYRWQMDNPWHRLELRFSSDPVPGSEIFLKAYGDVWITVNNIERKDKFFLDEAHMKYRWGEKDTLETFLFFRELRFWLGDPLLNLANNDQDKWNDKKVSGLSSELNGCLPNFWMKFFLARMFDANTDAAGVRIQEKWIRDRLHTGLTVTYKNWHAESTGYNAVAAADIWGRLYQFDLAAEGAVSDTPTITDHRKENWALKTELRRNIDLDSAGIGDIGLIASVRDIGRNFRAYLSKDYDNDRKFDQRGYFFEGKVKVARKAVTLTVRRDYFQRHKRDYSVTDDQAESYVEFIRGFRWKNFFQAYRERDREKVSVTLLDGSVIETDYLDNLWRHFLTQLEMENRTAYVKLQFKIKNMFTDYLKILYGVEYSINITAKLKSINRLVIADEVYRSRTSLFSQIQYRFGENTDFYLGYGNEDDTRDDMVNDDDFAESDKGIEHKVHLYVRASF